MLQQASKALSGPGGGGHVSKLGGATKETHLDKEVGRVVREPDGFADKVFSGCFVPLLGSSGHGTPLCWVSYRKFRGWHFGEPHQWQQTGREDMAIHGAMLAWPARPRRSKTKEQAQALPGLGSPCPGAGCGRLWLCGAEFQVEKGEARRDKKPGR